MSLSGDLFSRTAATAKFVYQIQGVLNWDNLWDQLQELTKQDMST